jgi:3-oxoacyl-[acyl-carrier protein] reductase
MSKVAIVTGSSRGIGRACALRLAKEGMDVVINYNSNEAEAMKVVEAIKEMGQDAIAIKANTGNQADVKNMFREAFKHFGHIDVLVNNAGVLDDAYLLAMNSDSLDRSLDVNIKGYFYCCQQAALKMFKTGGRIVNVSSVSSMLALAGQSVYGATKGAVNSMTATLAKELAPYGIQVNAVAPGFIVNERSKLILGTVEEGLTKRGQDVINHTPMGKFGSANDMCGAIRWLIDDRSAGFVTGITVPVDGGFLTLSGV